MARLAALVAAALACGGCASFTPPEDVHEALGRTLRAAQARQAAGYHAEAAVLVLAIEGVDRDLPGLDAVRGALDQSVREAMNRDWLGSNRRLRPHVDRPTWQRVALYVPDRLLDLVDVVSVSGQLGWGVLFDVHATHAVNATLGLRSSGGLGLHELRSLGLKSQAEGGISVFPLGLYSYAGGLVGTSGVIAVGDSVAGMHRPQVALYQELRDYWEIGARGFAGLVGADVAVHPVQLADFFAGLVGIDFLNDDFARTRGLEQSHVEEHLVRNLWAVRRSRRTLDAYLEARRSGALGAALPYAVERVPARPERESGGEVPAAPEER
jgi:hypothetical protein